VVFGGAGGPLVAGFGLIRSEPEVGSWDVTPWQDPNRLPDMQVTRPNQVWVTDATCVLTGQGWLYVTALLDVYSRRIVGWSMHETWDACFAVRALEMAIAQRRPPAGLIVHSDRGVQFASAAFRAKLQAHGMVASMSRKGNCYDNAFIESFWSSLKYETVYHRRYATRAEARTAIFDYIEVFYNRTRLHSSLGYVSPTTFESKLN
jgi:transposase InsO family protein